MKIGIIDYKAGNIRSVQFACQRLGIESVLTDDPEVLQRCDRLIFPGVGEAGSAMKRLQEKGLDHFIQKTKQPLLGICLGMQLLCKFSEEGNTTCLGIFDVDVKRFPHQGVDGQRLKVPQVGWNTIEKLKSPLFKHIPEETYMYYVHGYYAALCEHTIAETEYGIRYSGALHRTNFFGVQFHPEKSGEAGENIIKNFFSIQV